jgi:hypothetical protein
LAGGGRREHGAIMLRRALALTALSLGVVAAPAGAATYSASGTSLTVSPLAGEANRVVLQTTTSGADTFWLVTQRRGRPGHRGLLLHPAVECAGALLDHRHR